MLARNSLLQRLAVSAASLACVNARNCFEARRSNRKIAARLAKKIARKPDCLYQGRTTVRAKGSEGGPTLALRSMARASTECLPWLSPRKEAAFDGEKELHSPSSIRYEYRSRSATVYFHLSVAVKTIRSEERRVGKEC